MSYVDPKGFLKGLEFRHFMDTPEEWHAFVNGFCEVLCPWKPHTQQTQQTQQTLNSEYHYYMFGRGIGVIAWLIIAKLIQEVFF